MAEVNNAAAEIARKMAIEAAKQRAAAEAKKRQAEVAKKQQDDAAKKQQADTAKKTETAPKLEKDQAGGLLGGLVAKVKDAAKTMEKAAETAHKQTVKDTKQSMTEIKADMKKADSPKDLEKLTERAKAMSEKADGDSMMKQELKDDVTHLTNKLEKTHEAVQTLQDAKKGLKGTIDERAAATAELLANGEKLGGLKGLKGMPLAEKAMTDLKEIQKEAKPEVITEALENNPSIAHDTPGMAENLARLRGLNDPKLNAAIDQSASDLLNREGGLTLEQVKANPGLGMLVGTSQDPAVQAKLKETATNWAKESVKNNLEGKEGEEGVEEAMQGFQEELKQVAEATGGTLNGALDEGAKAAGADEDVKKAIEDTTNEGKSIFEKVTGAISGAVSGAFNGIGKVISKGFEVAGSGMELLGKVNPLNIAAKGLDAVGLDGAADLVGKGGKLLEGGYKLAGDFTKGVGDGLAGTVTGVGQMVAHPLATAKGLAHLATHPGELATVGKALWKEASKHGIAGAIGYTAGMAAPMLLSGGGAGASLAGRGATLAATGATKAGTATNFLAKGAGLAMEKSGLLMGKAGQLAGKPGELFAASKLGQAMTKPAAVIKDLADGKISNAVRQLGRPADDIRDLASKGANKTFTEGAKDFADLGKAGVGKVKEFFQNPKKLIDEAKTNRKTALETEQKALEAAKKDLNDAGLKAQAKDIEAIAKDSGRKLDGAAQKELAKKAETGGVYEGQISAKTMEKLKKGTLNEKDAGQLDRSLEVAKKLDDAYTVLESTKAFKITNATIRAGAHVARIAKSPVDGVLALFKIDKTRLIHQDVRSKHFNAPDTFSPGRAIIAGQAGQMVQTSEKEQAKQRELDKLNELTGDALPLK